jgi:hypothetical protein
MSFVRPGGIRILLYGAALLVLGSAGSGYWFYATFLRDLPDLQSVADANAGERQRDSRRGEGIVDEEQIAFENWLLALKAVPTIRHLKARAEAVRTSEIEKAVGRLNLTGGQLEGVEAITRAIVNKVLHAPVTRLRNETESEGASSSIEEARALFALDDTSAPGAHADDELHAEMERARLGDSRPSDPAVIDEPGDEDGEP